MIKNKNQLKRAQVRFRFIQDQIEQYQSQYSGIDLELYVLPLKDEKDELMQEILEYQELRDLSLEENVQGLLSEPIIIDNISELLAMLRIAAKLSQDEFANRLGWKQSNLSRFESENYSSQTVSKIVEFASALGIWLHVTPSLTEKISEFSYRKESQQIPRSGVGSTSIESFDNSLAITSIDNFSQDKEKSETLIISDISPRSVETSYA